MIIFDLDGTIADCSHRVQHAQSGEWDAFHDGLMGDKVYHAVKEFIHMLHDTGGNILVIVTGRPEKYRSATEVWLEKIGIFDCFDQIVMRPNDNFQKDYDFKLEAVQAAERCWKQPVTLILEDRDRNVEHLRNAGYAVWQTRAGDY